MGFSSSFVQAFGPDVRSFALAPVLCKRQDEAGTGSGRWYRGGNGIHTSTGMGHSGGLRPPPPLALLALLLVHHCPHSLPHCRRYSGLVVDGVD